MPIAQKKVAMKLAPNHTVTKWDRPAAKLFSLSGILHYLSDKRINGVQLTSKSRFLSGNSYAHKIHPTEAEMKENQKWHRKFINMNI